MTRAELEAAMQRQIRSALGDAKRNPGASADVLAARYAQIMVTYAELFASAKADKATQSAVAWAEGGRRGA